MHLAGQAQACPGQLDPRTRLDRGYAMAALLVAMSVMAVLMSVAMPVWSKVARREKEAELIFRGLQYARAIDLFGRRYPGAMPPNFDILVEQKFLRKKYKDPITGDDFEPVRPTQALPGPQGTPGGPGSATGGRGITPGGRGSPPGGRGSPPAPAAGGQSTGGRGGLASRGSTFGPAPGAQAGAAVGIAGVVSKSKEESIRLYNGRNHYNEWIFQAVQRTLAPGVGGAPGTPTPGMPSGGPGQRGTGPNTQPGGGRGPAPGGRGPYPDGGRGPAGGRGPNLPRLPAAPDAPPRQIRRLRMASGRPGAPASGPGFNYTTARAS